MLRRGASLAFILHFILTAIPGYTQSGWSTTNCPQSRKEAMVWYFGDKAGIDFLSGTATALTDQNVMTAFKASSSICDSMGNFLFFTNGNKVWDRTFTLMPNATGLAGDLGATQPCIIVPWPGDSTLYYIFTVDILQFTDSVTYKTDGLTATIIDLKERGGLGDATSTFLNKPLLSPVTQKLTAVKHRNGKDYWVIVHKWDSDEFHSWHITPYGIAPAIVSKAGSIHGGKKAQANNAVGYMKASPDGTKIALAVEYKKVIELFDFDNETGAVTNPRSYNTTIPGVNPYGIEFSPDGRKLYATVFETGGVEKPSRPSFILQFNLANGLSNPVLIDSVPGVRLGAIQLGPDGRIYISRTNNLTSKRDSLEVIYSPGRSGKACNFNHLDGQNGAGFSLSGRTSIYSLPNIVQSFVNIPAFRWDSVCQKNTTMFQITNTANTDSLRWSFGDGSGSVDENPAHYYSSPGAYNVVLTQYYQGIAYSDTMVVTNYKLPEIALADTVMLYTGSTINLRAGGGFTEYQWSTGSTDSVINVGTEGQYRVRVKDVHCCYNYDTTYVKVFGYYIPNAFTPNGDGLNDVFRVTGLYRNINFSMIVYDRWGRQVFESKNIDTGWDGSFGGKLCDPDTYVWIVTVAFKGNDIITQGDVKFNGTVTLVK
jgi:gliding motility-associated-like protein